MATPHTHSPPLGSLSPPASRQFGVLPSALPHLGGPNSHLPARQHCTLKRTSTAGIASDRSLSTSPQTPGSHQSPRDLLQPSPGVPEAAASAPAPRLCPGVRAVPATSASSLKLEFASGDLLPVQPVKQSGLAAMANVLQNDF